MSVTVGAPDAACCDCSGHHGGGSGRRRRGGRDGRQTLTEKETRRKAEAVAVFPAMAVGDGEAQLRDDVNSNLEWHVVETAACRDMCVGRASGGLHAHEYRQALLVSIDHRNWMGQREN